MKKLFLKGNDRTIPTLYYDMVFVESTRPILFTCKDDKDSYYICSCYIADGEKCQWLVVPTTCERLLELLTNQITIRQIFDRDEKNGFLVTALAGEGTPTAKTIAIESVSPEILPTAGYYMEAEPEEFEQEIAELKKALKTTTTIKELSFKVCATQLPIEFQLSPIYISDRGFCKKSIHSRPASVCV